MIDTVTFILPSGAQVSPATYGLILKSFDAEVPKPKLNMISISGRDGSLDLTEWAGEVRYENRKVNIAFLDMQGDAYIPMLNMIYRGECKIIHSVDDDYYYLGRCVSAEPRTRRHVTDLELEFSCQPYRLSVEPTTVERSVSESPIFLQAERMSAIPLITLTADCTITFGGVTKSLEAGSHTVPEFVITKAGGSMIISGSGTITITWTEGVI